MFEGTVDSIQAVGRLPEIRLPPEAFSLRVSPREEETPLKLRNERRGNVTAVKERPDALVKATQNLSLMNPKISFSELRQRFKSPSPLGN